MKWAGGKDEENEMGMATLFLVGRAQKLHRQLRATTHFCFSRLREKSEKKRGGLQIEGEGTNGGKHQRKGKRERGRVVESRPESWDAMGLRGGRQGNSRSRGKAHGASSLSRH